jgi:L-lactate dehydrogenase (cytochrome)
MNLRLLGARTIKDVVPAMVDASNIYTHLVAVPRDQLYDANCTCLTNYSGRELTGFQMRACNMHV